MLKWIVPVACPLARVARTWFTISAGCHVPTSGIVRLV